MVARHMLVGWVPISKFFDVDERTARRWAELPEDPLPVFNRNATSVAAWKDDLAAWQVRREERRGGKRKARPSISREAA